MVGSGMFKGLGELIIGLFVVALLSVLSLIGLGVYFLFAPDKVVSERPITPELKITVENNRIDTLYIYEAN